MKLFLNLEAFYRLGCLLKAIAYRKHLEVMPKFRYNHPIFGLCSLPRAVRSRCDGREWCQFGHVQHVRILFQKIPIQPRQSRRTKIWRFIRSAVSSWDRNLDTETGTKADEPVMVFWRPKINENVDPTRFITTVDTNFLLCARGKNSCFSFAILMWS